MKVNEQQHSNQTALGSPQPRAAEASTGAANEGGNPLAGSARPRLVIPGENPDKEERYVLSLVDWLTFTFRLSGDSKNPIREVDDLLKEAFGFGLGPCRNTNHLGYEQSWVIGDQYGRFATGGDSVAGTSLVFLSGRGCSVIVDWQRVHDVLKRINAKITRVDLSYDDFYSEVPFSEVLKWHSEGRFYTGRGRPPRGRLIDDFGSGEGKTLYIGKRENGKMLRIYEKGKQWGFPDSPWVRWELEMLAHDRHVPLDALLRPGDYLAGAYPCMNWISETQFRVSTISKSLAIGVDVLTHYCRQSYGKLLWFLLEVKGLTPEEVCDLLKVKGIPRRLDLGIPGEVEQ